MGTSNELKTVDQFCSLSTFQKWRDLIQKGDWIIKLDKKDTYFTVPIDPQHQPLLRFIYVGTSFLFTKLLNRLWPFYGDWV